MNANIHDMKPWSETKKELFKNKAFAKAYKEMQPEFTARRALIEARLKKGMTQAKLAKKLGTKQSSIARLESARNFNPTLSFMKNLAKALDKELVITFR